MKRLDINQKQGDDARMDDLLTLREVMRELRCGHRVVTRMIERGDLTPMKWGLYPKFRREEVEQVKRGRATNETNVSEV